MRRQAGINNMHKSCYGREKKNIFYFLGCKLWRYSLGVIPRCFEQ